MLGTTGIQGVYASLIWSSSAWMGLVASMQFARRWGLFLQSIVAPFITAVLISTELHQEMVSEVLHSYKFNENSLFAEMRERLKLNPD